MNVDELANSLVAQENLNRLGGETKRRLEEELALARANGETDKVRMLEASLGNEAEAKAALEKLDAQTKFNAAIDKLKSMLSSIVEGPALKFAERLAGFLSDSKNLVKILNTIKAIIIGIAIAWAVMNPYAALAGLAAAGAVYAFSNSTPKAAKGGTVVGKGSVMVGEEGPEVLSLNPGATITPLSKTNAATEVYSSKESISPIDYDKLAEAMSRRPTYLDSQKVNLQSNLSAVSVQ
jgi:hypothetical protein